MNRPASPIHQFSDLATATSLTPPPEVTLPAAIVADAAGSGVMDDNGVELPSTWHAVACIEGLLSGDGRMMQVGSLGARPVPLPFMFSSSESYAHQDAKMAGSITSIERNADLSCIVASGTFDLGGDVGREAARTCRDQLVRFVSVHLVDMEYEWVYTGDPWDDDFYDDGFMLVTKANIASLTQLPIPCYAQCVVAPEGVELDMSLIPTPDEAASGPLTLVASAESPLFSVPDKPPLDWFGRPEFEFDGPAITITDEGRVYLRVAVFGRNHIGFPSDRVNAPKSGTDYSYFKRGRVQCLAADGQVAEVRTGPLVMGTKHADGHLHSGAAQDHYDNTGSGVADIAVGEDSVGIWAAGCLRPGLTQDQVRVIRASSVSGDWRRFGGRNAPLDFAALLVVNTPGFPTALAASAGIVEEALQGPRGYIDDEGHQLSLVAAGRPRGPRDQTAVASDLHRRLRELEQLTEGLRSEQARNILDQLRG